ncbi:hypothetical protein E2C01_026856 [Portunus trituberculatus]|uniref:Uncharacterized protein n=1 Tax=Portunus trituberculatus TaxID=210409 RepID=A0A5B7EM60_PORTR|nr:hypothetical protein [Portunus trituberculatus]
MVSVLPSMDHTFPTLVDLNKEQAVLDQQSKCEAAANVVLFTHSLKIVLINRCHLRAMSQVKKAMKRGGGGGCEEK